MEQLNLGVCGTSRKESEYRLAIHPLHLDRIEAGLRARVFLERGYGERFGVADARLAPLVAGVRSRQQLIAGCAVIVLPKPAEGDIAGLREGQVLWGWPLRPGLRRHPAGHRPPADPDRLGGHALLDGRRQ